MKKITILLMLFISAIGFSQTYDLLESFNGTGYEGTFGGTTAAYDADPTDNATQVVKITSTNGSGEIWQGVNVTLSGNYTLTAATQLTMQLDVYSNSAITIAPKAQGGISGAPDSVTFVDHTGSGWETLTFTFDKSLDNKGAADGTYSDFALHINWDKNGNTYGTPDGREFYIKNLKGLSSTATVAAPTDAPAAPTASASDVISLYSDAYTDVASNRTPGWGETIAEEMHASNNVIKSDNFLPFQLTSPIDITGKTLHVDFWIETLPAAGSGLLIKLLDAANGPHEANYIHPNTSITEGSWNSIDIPLTSFSQAQGTWDATAQSRVDQVLLDIVDDATIYFDNIYFYTDSGSGGGGSSSEPTDAPAAPTASASDVISLFSDAYTDVASNTTPGWGEGVTAEMHASNNVIKSTNFLPFQLTSPIDITGKTLHVDFWIETKPAAGAGLLIKLLDAANGPHEGNYIHPMSSITEGSWNSIDIPLSSFTQAQGTWDATAQARIDQVLVDIVDDATIFLDNIYFYTDSGSGGGSSSEPTDAPAAPTASASDVISLYSDAYTDVASNTTPGWGEGVTAEMHASNNVIKSSNFLPFALNSPIDITGHTLHVDFWIETKPAAGAGLLIKLLDAANGPHEGNYIHPMSSITEGSWNSIDIPVSSFNQVQGTWDATAQSRVDQVLVDIVDDATIFIDNVYFYSATASVRNNDLLGFSMYPNPVNDKLNISAAETIKRADIFNVLGKKVMSATINNTRGSVDVSKLATGIYLIKYNVNDKVGTAKFIKQ